MAKDMKSKVYAHEMKELRMSGKKMSLKKYMEGEMKKMKANKK